MILCKFLVHGFQKNHIVYFSFHETIQNNNLGQFLLLISFFQFFYCIINHLLFATTT